MISNYNEKEGTTTFYFKKEICSQCSLKYQCTKQEGRTIAIGKHHDLMIEAKEYNKTQDFKDDMKERAHIEPKNAEMKRFHGMARARYWGLPKVNVQFIITAIVVNVKRLANVIGSVCYPKILFQFALMMVPILVMETLLSFNYHFNYYLATICITGLGLLLVVASVILLGRLNNRWMGKMFRIA